MIATLTFGGTLQWAVDNWKEMLGALGMLVAASSALIKALEVLVSILVKLFPGLKTVDGDLLGAAAWLDSLAQSGFLRTASLAPKTSEAVPQAPAASPNRLADVRIVLGLAAVIALFVSTGCASVKAELAPFPGQAKFCAGPLPAEAVQLLPVIESALQSQNFGPLIVAAAGDLLPFAKCLVGAMVNDLESKAALAPDWVHAAPVVTKLVHAHAFLAATAGR